MKSKPIRIRNFASRFPPRPYFCSLRVLASLGALALSLPAQAQVQVQAQAPKAVLPAGTLPVLRGVVSGQAVVNAPVRGAERSLLTIDQASQRAVLDWRSFNISSDAEVLFRQPGSQASALNRIYDADPSVIQGKLSSTGPLVDGKPTAGGQVILINQNGILFDRGAQVNTQSLVASTLNLSNPRFLSGALTSGGLTSPAFEGGYDEQGNTLAARPDGTRPGAITIGAGGPTNAAAPMLAANAGGSVMLFAPRIDNSNGVITTPDGQLILAAGRKVYLALNEDESNTTLRGFRVEVEADQEGPGLNLTNLIRNAGQLSADRGNVSLAALAINQEGRVSAKTAVQANGSIYLKARTRDGVAGTVTLGQGSMTEVQPDAGDKATMANSADYAPLRGTIEVDGHTIDSRGAIRAPGGRIVLRAADASDPDAARVYLDAGSETSVAGAWAELPYSSNLLTFRVTSNELKNSPDQKTGVLRGAQVTVDLARGSNILDLSGYIGAQARTVTEKAAAGGVMTIDSTGSVIQRAGATIDASGGGYRYAGGTANTTRLLGDDGRVYDIATAPKDRLYVSQLDSFTRTDERWGQTATYANPLGSFGVPEAGFVQGQPGGSVQITATSGLVLDGNLKGGVTLGPRQFTRAPRGASLTLGQFNPSQPEETRLIGGVTFVSTSNDGLGTGFTSRTQLPADRLGELTLSAHALFGTSQFVNGALVETGFGAVELNSGAGIFLPADVDVEAPTGSTLILRAGQVDLAGRLHLPGGQITVPASPAVPLTPLDIGAPLTRIVVRSGAELSTAGTWINNASADGSFAGGAVPSARLNAAGTGTTSSAAGGSISLTAQSVLLQDGALLDVGGGGAIDRSGRVTGGSGGSLSIANGISSEAASDWLRADLRGFSLTNGGQLSITTPQIVVDREDANGTLPSSTTRLGPSLFSEYGFSSVRLSAPFGLEVKPDTVIHAQQKNWVIDPVLAKTLPTGGDLTNVATIQTLADAARAPVNVSLVASSTTTTRSTITLAEGAAIVADPRARVSLSAADGMTINGSIVAPAGEVSLTLNGLANTTVPPLTLGAKALVSTAGTFVPTVSDRGLVQGSVLAGGTVTLDAINAGVMLAAGSHIDVSGARREVDVSGSGAGAPSLRVPIDAAAGTVVIKSQGATLLGGTFRGDAPSTTSAGGSFALELQAPDGTPSRPDTQRIIVTPYPIAQQGESGFVDAPVAIYPLVAGGFDKLRLQAEDGIEFRGDVRLTFDRGIRLDAPVLNVTGNGTVAIEGATVSIGQSLGPRLFGGTSYSISPLDASPALATRDGAGSLTVRAQGADIFGSLTVNGVNQLTIDAERDIRLIGRAVQSTVQDADGLRPVSQLGSLTTTADITLKAAQVYPTTRSSFTVAVKDGLTGALAPDGVVRVTSSGAAPGDVYSAGGKITIEAGAIEQRGRIKAPLGEIELKAGSRVELATGSLTSVSADGLTIPYGTTSAGVVWTYADTNSVSQNSSVKSVTATGKRVSFSGAMVDLQQGAIVDLSGGGDVLAAEFVPGSGGDTDTTLKDNTFAIIPKSRLTGKPIDTDIAVLKDIGFGFGSARQDTALYDSIQIGSGGAVPAGEYALLPARYALLPDAYLVQLQSGTVYSNLKLGDKVALSNGNTVLAGFRMAGGTSVRESISVGVVVRPGSAARLESDYTLTGSQFFADTAARERTDAVPLPRDAGRMDITRAALLNLDGQVRSAAAKSADGSLGELAQFNISGPRIAIVDQVGSTAVGSDFLQVSSASLSRLDGSVLLGGVRSKVPGGVSITTEAETIVAANSAQAPVVVPELLLSANESIDIRSGAALRGSGAATSPTPATLFAAPSGALVRLSNGGQTSLDRGASVSALTGEVLIGTGATLVGDGSVLVDATRTVRSRGSVRTNDGGGSISLASSRLSLGEVSGSESGLILSNADLAAYGVLDSLTLRGYGGIDLYGSAALGTSRLGELVLDTPALRGLSGAAASSILEAGTITLLNRGSAPGQAAAPGTGSLTLQADRINFGIGDKIVTGFSSVKTVANAEIVGQAAGSLTVGADWTLQAQRLRGDSGSNQTWSARDPSGSGASAFKSMRIEAAAAPINIDEDTALGARLSLEGQRVSLDTTVQALSGRVSIAARGAGSGDDITVGASGKVVARGAVKDFNGATAVADGGNVTLAAASGISRVNLAAGSLIDVSAAAGGGNAGALRFVAADLAALGDLAGSATPAGRSGRVDIDIRQMSAPDGFSALNRQLNQGGFADSRRLRLRNGDINVAAEDTVTARDVNLSADSGRVLVAGTVGSGSTARGAAIGLYAGSGVTLAAGSIINAGARQGHADADGGDVAIAARGGAVVFDAAAQIDVGKGERGRTGSVTFTLQRDSANQLGASDLQGTVLSRRQSSDEAATVAVEAQRSYLVGSTISASDISSYATQHQSFINSASPVAVVGGIKGDNGGSVNAVLRGATELRAAGDLRIDPAWNLTTGAWLAGGQPGTLSVLAAGNLTIANAIGSATDDIVAGSTWSLRAVAGADLAAAMPTTVLSADQVATGKGDLLLTGANARLRTGTGSIQMAAARDVRMDNVRNVVYTGGRIGAGDAANTQTLRFDRWAIDGGDISLSAGRDVVGPTSASGDLWITDWYRRTRQLSAAWAEDRTTDWWAYRPHFQQGIGALAGGNVDVAAGRDVSNLAAMLPTTGRTYRDSSGQRQVEVQGGGDLRVLAGNNVVGGGYLVGRGEGVIDAAGDVGRTRPIQLYVMGASSGDVPTQSSFDVDAGGTLSLQSVNNPTVLAQFGVPGVSTSTPSFTTSGSIAAFFTYSPSSAVSLRAEGGDVSLEPFISTQARSLGNANIASVQRSGGAALPAFPANLSVVAFEGSVQRAKSVIPLVTFPSPTAEVKILANDSISSLQVSGSDRSPATVSTPFTVQPFTLLAPNAVMAGNSLLATGSQARILDRDVAGPYVYDIQALTGSITDAGLYLPAVSRVAAGEDVLRASLTLQNLNDSDVSVLRAYQGDIRAPVGIEIRGPGQLLLQAGRNVDLGQARVRLGDVFPAGLLASGSNSNPNLGTATSARITVVAGVPGEFKLSRLDAAYQEVIALNGVSTLALAFYAQLAAEPVAQTVLEAKTVVELAAKDTAYDRFKSLDKDAPRLLKAYQNTLRGGSLPLGATPDSDAVSALYALLNAEADTQKLAAAGSLATLASRAGEAAYLPFLSLDQRYPRLFKDYVQRRTNGARPTSITPIVFSDAVAEVVAEVVSPQDVASGNIDSFRTSIQTFGGSDIDLIAPGGSIVTGLTTPSAGATIGVLTNSGGAIRSLVSGNFDINQGKVLTAQGGDILILTTQGSIDAGRGAKTSLSTPPPTRTPIFTTVDGESVIVGYVFSLPTSASGSGIQTLTSDPDGAGPRATPDAGNVYLFAPAGSIDAGEAGIRSSGNILLNAQVVRNASNISVSGSSVGVPVATSGSLASSVASSGANTAGTSKAGDEAASASSTAARAAAAAQLAKPTILVVEVLGFGDKNCKEQDKNCFAK